MISGMYGLPLKEKYAVTVAAASSGLPNRESSAWVTVDRGSQLPSTVVSFRARTIPKGFADMLFVITPEIEEAKSSNSNWLEQYIHVYVTRSLSRSRSRLPEVLQVQIEVFCQKGFHGVVSREIGKGPTRKFVELSTRQRETSRRARICAIFSKACGGRAASAWRTAASSSGWWRRYSSSTHRRDEP